MSGGYNKAVMFIIKRSRSKVYQFTGTAFHDLLSFVLKTSQHVNYAQRIWSCPFNTTGVFVEQTTLNCAKLDFPANQHAINKSAQLLDN